MAAGVSQRFLEVGERVYRAGLKGVEWGYARNLLRRHRLPAQVVSVGNLTWGGTGKTPLVLHLARAFQERGRRVAVLTRGYGQDEPRLLAQALGSIPVLVDPDRVRSGTRAIREFQADLLLLDDGYQQWRLEKDVEILAVDASAPFGNRHLIPRGNLREPLSAAGRADLVVLKKGTADPLGFETVKRQLHALNPRAPVFQMEYQPAGLWRWPSREPAGLDALKGAKTCTLAGIANPAHFEAMAASLGAKVALRYRAQDHHPYTAGELVKLLARCRRHEIGQIVTTAKDAVRIPKLFIDTVGLRMSGFEILVLEIHPTFDPDESELLHRIDSLLAR